MSMRAATTWDKALTFAKSPAVMPSRSSLRVSAPACSWARSSFARCSVPDSAPNRARSASVRTPSAVSRSRWASSWVRAASRVSSSIRPSSVPASRRARSSAAAMSTAAASARARRSSPAASASAGVSVLSARASSPRRGMDRRSAGGVRIRDAGVGDGPGGVGLSPAGESDVGAGPVRLRGEEQVAGVDGAALGAVRGRRVRKREIGGGVVGGDRVRVVPVRVEVAVRVPCSSTASIR